MGWHEDKDDLDSSIDSDVALLEFLGLDPTDDVTSSLKCFDLPEEESVHETDDDLRSPYDYECDEHDDSDTVFVPIALPPKCSRYGHAPQHCAAVLVDGFCDATECQAIIDMARRQSPKYITEATHTSADGTTFSVLLPNPNPHKLAVFQHEPTLTLLEDRMWRLLHSTSSKSRPSWLSRFQARTGYGPAIGLNPKLRVLQYDAADKDRFEPHFDATTVVRGKSSRITVLLYLNSGRGCDFDGGDTFFLDNTTLERGGNSAHSMDELPSSLSPSHSVAPQTGRLVLFEHNLFHSSAPLQWGTKFVLRTDILMEDSAELKTDDHANGFNCSDNVDTGDETDVPPPLLLIDLCQRLEWPQLEQDVLRGMGLLHGTIDAFLVPGRDILMDMLSEHDIPRRRIDALLQMAMEYQRG